MHSPPVPAHVFHLHWEKRLGSFSFFCCFPFPFAFFIHFSYFIIALYLILSVLVAVFFFSYEHESPFCYFYKTALHLCKCTAGLFWLFSLCSSLETDPHAMQRGALYCDAQVTSGLGSITLSTSEPSQFTWPHLPGFDLTDQTYLSTKKEPQDSMIWGLFVL